MKYPRTVYALQHNKTKKIYIGSSRNVELRIRNHLSRLKEGKHLCKCMQKDCDEFGNDFSFFILDEVEDVSQIEKEYEWMEKYKSYDERYGYNVGDLKRFKKTKIKFEEGLPTGLYGKVE